MGNEGLLQLIRVDSGDSGFTAEDLKHVIDINVEVSYVVRVSNLTWSYNYD